MHEYKIYYKRNNMKDGKVFAKDVVTVYGTGVGRFLAEGSKHVVHKIAAENLVAKGFASYDVPEGAAVKSSSKSKKSKSEEI